MSCYLVLSPPVSGQPLSALPPPTSPSTGGPVGYYTCIMIFTVFFSPLYPQHFAHNSVDPTHPFSFAYPHAIVLSPPVSGQFLPALPPPTSPSVQAGWLVAG